MPGASTNIVDTVAKDPSAMMSINHVTHCSLHLTVWLTAVAYPVLLHGVKVHLKKPKDNIIAVVADVERREHPSLFTLADQSKPAVNG